MLPKPLKVYLDTSIFNFAISAQDVPREKELTNKFLDGTPGTGTVLKMRLGDEYPEGSASTKQLLLSYLDQK